MVIIRFKYKIMLFVMSKNIGVLSNQVKGFGDRVLLLLLPLLVLTSYA